MKRYITSIVCCVSSALMLADSPQKQFFTKPEDEQTIAQMRKSFALDGITQRVPSRVLTMERALSILKGITPAQFIFSIYFQKSAIETLVMSKEQLTRLKQHELVQQVDEKIAQMFQTQEPIIKVFYLAATSREGAAIINALFEDASQEELQDMFNALQSYRQFIKKYNIAIPEARTQYFNIWLAQFLNHGFEDIDIEL